MTLSSFTWLDHAPDDVRRVREALAAFDEQGMVDPLGFGVVRDAFSEMLFPGTSTVQTRARYFLLVPWVYRILDIENIDPSGGASRARALEVGLIESLLRGSASSAGIIGGSARQAVKQLPSFVYWGGLGRWGIRRFPGTRSDYVATLDCRRKAAARAGRRTVEAEWHPNLPAEPHGLYDSTSLDLGENEADFLRDRILNSTPHTYLSVLVRDGDSTQVADTPWEHPLAAKQTGHLAHQLHHAKLFAIASWGAALLYNVELSALLEGDGGEPLKWDYRADLDLWLESVDGLGSEFAAWNRAEFWHTVRTSSPAIAPTAARFVDWWLDQVVSNAKGAIDDRDVRRTLTMREAAMKGPRAKLANRRARERSPGAQGGDLLTFRWSKVSRIVRDIHEGLETGA